MTSRSIATALSFAAAATAFIALVAATGSPDQRQTLRTGLESVRTLLVEHFADVQARTGLASALVARVDADLSQVLQIDSAAVSGDWDVLALTAQLDESLVTQAVSGKYHDAGGVRGAASFLFDTSADRTMQPLAVYVPAPYEPHKAAPLIIMLHGQGQTETELLAVPWLRELADQTGAIFAVPWARGDQAFDATTSSDIYDALKVLESAYNVDQRRVYLAGVSWGGMSVFLVGPRHPERWSALLSIAGTLTNDDKQSVVDAMKGKQIFLVIGSDDQIIKAAYVRGAAAYLVAHGVEGRYYEQPNGEHSLASLRPVVERAWRDMFSGVRLVSPDVEVPSPHPAASQRY